MRHLCSKTFLTLSHIAQPLAIRCQKKFTNAQIVITDKSGKTLKEINVSGSCKGSLNVDASTLLSGAYQYSLIMDKKLIATKQMVLAK